MATGKNRPKQTQQFELPLIFIFPSGGLHEIFGLIRGDFQADQFITLEAVH
jgi:hypothetical protein